MYYSWIVVCFLLISYSIHREFGQYSQRSFPNNRTSIPSKPKSQTIPFNRRGLDEQQAALNLAYLATTDPNINLTQTLIDALIVSSSSTQLPSKTT